MKIKSLFDYLPPVKDIEKEPLPSRIVKRYIIEGQIKDVVVERKKCTL